MTLGGTYINPESVVADVNDGNITISQSLASDTHMDRDYQWETGSVNNFDSPRFIQTPMTVLDATNGGDDHTVDKEISEDDSADGMWFF